MYQNLNLNFLFPLEIIIKNILSSSLGTWCKKYTSKHNLANLPNLPYSFQKTRLRKSYSHFITK